MTGSDVVGFQTWPIETPFKRFWRPYQRFTRPRENTTAENIEVRMPRPRNNVRGAKMSEHGFGNAIDIAAFTLEDGRKVSVLHDYYGSAASQRFLRQVRGEACGEFATVLGPGTDANHRDHIHLDLQNRRSGQAYCH